MTKVAQIVRPLKEIFLGIGATLLIIISLLVVLDSVFEIYFQDRIYPGVRLGGVIVGGRSEAEIDRYFLAQTQLPSAVAFTYTDMGKEGNYPLDLTKLGLRFDVPVMTARAYSIGRQTNNYYYNLLQKLAAFLGTINLPIEVSYDQGVLTDWENSLRPQTDKEPVDAQFKFEPEAGPDGKGRVTAFRQSDYGRALNHDQLIIALRNLLLTGTCSQGAVCKLPLPVLPVPPHLTASAADRLGIKDLLGSGQSFFYDSIPGRVENIRVGTQKISGSLIAPGETFSFNNSIGTVSAVFGFRKAYIIKDNKTVLDDGGGVCQVSTTLYRAVIAAGLPVLARTAHAYRVGFYEEGGFLPGIDATVFPPAPDFKFKNDTAGWLLLQATFDETKSQLTFDIFGSSDGRRVTITKPVFLSTTPPPAPIYEDDPTKPVGSTEQVDTAHWGASVYFQRKVERDGKILIDETVRSDYIPWPARYLRGVKTG